jgi:hypothetical protein
MGSEHLHCTRPPSEPDAEFDARFTASEQHVGSIVSDLVEIAAHLRFVLGTAIALDLALRRQGADQDIDLADCLRFGVIGSTAQQLRRTVGLIRRLGGTVPEALDE